MKVWQIILALLGTVAVAGTVAYVALRSQPTPETAVDYQHPRAGYTLKTQTCPICHGTGFCALCGGTGALEYNGVTIECAKECTNCDGYGVVTLRTVEYQSQP